MDWNITSVEQDSFGPCGVCGETLRADDELGEFATADGKHVLAHSQCGIDAALAVA